MGMNEIEHLEGEALDAVVHKALLGEPPDHNGTLRWSRDWSSAGVLIEEHGICLTCYDRLGSSHSWKATVCPGGIADFARGTSAYGRTALEAACRAFVLSKSKET